MSLSTAALRPSAALSAPAPLALRRQAASLALAVALDANDRRGIDAASETIRALALEAGLKATLGASPTLVRQADADEAFGSAERASDREEPPFNDGEDARPAPVLRALQGGKRELAEHVARAKAEAKALPKARKVRGLAPLEALCLAWLAGLVHDELHPEGARLEDEGSQPVRLPGEAASSAVLAILALPARGLVEVVAVDEGSTRYYLTSAGRLELQAQREGGHLTALLPVPGPVVPAGNGEGYTVVPCALFEGSFVALCGGCGASVSGEGWTRQRAWFEPAFTMGWHEKHGCPACQAKGGAR
jgi:hypothetical protein